MEGLRKAKRAAHRNNNVANSRSLGDVVQPPQGLCYGLPIDLSTESPSTNINCMLFYDDINQSGRKQQVELWPSDVVESTPNRLYSTDEPTGKQFNPCAGRSSRNYVPADASTSSVSRYSTPVVIRKVTTTPIVNPYSGTRTFNNPSQGNSTLTKSSPSPMMKQYTGAQKSLLSGGGLMHDGFSGMNPRKRPIPASTASNELATLARADDSSDSKDPHLLIPERFDSFDRFFAVLLRSSAMEYVGAGTGNGASMDLWKTLCDRVQLPLIYKKIASTCVEPKDHFALRASLVLEEARESLSSKLIERRTRHVGQKFSGDSLVKVTVQNIDERNYGITKLRCRGTHGFFSPKEKECLQVGTIFECTDRNSDDDELVFLGCVLPVEQKTMEKNASFDLAFYRPLSGNITKYSELNLIVVDNFLPLWRQFSAVFEQNPTKLSFMRALQGLTQEEPSSENTSNLSAITEDAALDDLLFVDAEMCLGLLEDESESKLDKDYTPLIRDDVSSMHDLCSLNETQKIAVNSFVESVPASITIVQGPPGTGKTTLLVTTISRYLLKFQDRQEGGRRLDRLAVCAPTNKAIVVLAERFIRAIASSSINAVVIGDAQKLLGINKRHSPLLPFFAYSFQEEIGKKLDDVKKWCISSNRPSDAWDKIICLKNHICRSLKGLHGEFKAKLESLCALFQSSNVGYEKLYKLTNDIYKEFTELPADVVLMDLLDSADVIFCTLCSSGCTVMKKTKSVGALIVDEAAAATEPEICIPFHLNPTRLLIVGDPKQLPATVLSERASKYGLSVSLHERLMYDCKMKYVMLDTQYRMNPEISSFASLRFYQGKISNAANVTSASYQKRGMLLDGRPYLFLETGGTEAKAFGGSCINTKEAVTILNLAKVLRDSNDSQWASPDSLRIITFYAAQVNLIRRMLDDNLMKDVVVSTVDSTQGCEADIVILSLVRTDVAGFLTDDRRLNVALTRARKQLICVGSVSTFSEMKDAPTLQLLASDAMTRNVIVPNRKVTVGSDVSCKRSSFVTQSEEEGEV